MCLLGFTRIDFTCFSSCGRFCFPQSNHRSLRAFKRWMRSQGIDFSDALVFTDGERGFGVKTLIDLEEGELIACIPKTACLTAKTTAASELIEEMQLGGALGLAVALMYEKSIGEKSLWNSYLQFLPEKECLPLLWSSKEIDRLLVGTELQKIVKEDQKLLLDDWKESIRPLLDNEELKLNPCHFGVEQYFAAKSLIASRSFDVDEYHGFGMVPLADIFNHKTGGEDVHFTLNTYSSDEEEPMTDGDNATASSYCASPSKTSPPQLHSSNGDTANNLSDSAVSNSEEFPDVLEMIMVRDVKAGCEIFNTYGNLGNAALLHRYGFTEPDNPFDIVNVDLRLVSDWSSSLFTARHSRARLLTWRKLGFSGCISEKSEYFEISFSGEPQSELVVLLYIMCLPEQAYTKLTHTMEPMEDMNESEKLHMFSEIMNKVLRQKNIETKDWMLNRDVCDALICLADVREKLYGLNSLEENVEMLSRCCYLEQPKLYVSLSLRISERKILGKLKAYANDAHRGNKRGHS